MKAALEIVRTSAFVLLALAAAWMAMHGLVLHLDGNLGGAFQVYTPNISVP
jgi:hypothetical protein